MIRHQKVDFIRHAESLGNLKDGYIDGRNLSVPLSPKGEEQAKELGLVYPLDGSHLLVSSTAIRSLQTARIAYPAHSISSDGRFVEMSQGDNEGELRSDVYSTEYLADIDHLGWEHRAPNGESFWSADR